VKQKSGIRVLIEFSGTKTELAGLTEKLGALGIRVLTDRIAPSPEKDTTLFAVGSWPIPDGPQSLIAINTVPLPDKTPLVSWLAINTVPIPDGPAKLLLPPLYEFLANLVQLR
jgi:hypothetical protein